MEPSTPDGDPATELARLALLSAAFQALRETARELWHATRLDAARHRMAEMPPP